MSNDKITRAIDTKPNPDDAGSIRWLNHLRNAADELCKEAFELHRMKGKDTPFASDALNWGDIHCIQAIWYRDADGAEGPIIELSEASPGGAYFFCEWICNRLRDVGFDNVTASTEW